MQKQVEGHDKKAKERDAEQHATFDDDTSSLGKGDVLQLEHTDPVLNAKMHLVNNAIDEIGFTRYQWKLFVLNGFGYAVDSLILLIQSIIAGQAALEFHPTYANGLTIAVYIGMLVGALFWGLTADIMGRKIAFNVSLIICSVFAIAAGASPNWEVLGLFTCLSAFGGGGNLVLDTAVFLEYLPSYRQWMLTLMACWWGTDLSLLLPEAQRQYSRANLTVNRSRPAHSRCLRMGLSSQFLLPKPCQLPKRRTLHQTQ